MSYNYGTNPPYNYGGNDPLAILRRFDVNGDGNITESDFVIAARELGLGWAEEQKMRQVFRTFDRNGNGRLDYNEAIEAVNILNGQRSSYVTTSSPYTSTSSTYSTGYVTPSTITYSTGGYGTSGYSTGYGTSYTSPATVYTTPTVYTSAPVYSGATSYTTSSYGGRDPMAILRRLDVNGDGNITESDFIIAARELGLDWAGEAQMRNTFKQLDRNGNGRLDYNEALEAVRILDTRR